MDRYHSLDDKREVFTDFAQKMADSGYQHSTRLEVAKWALKKYYRQVFTFDTYFDVKFQHLSVHGWRADHGNLNIKI